MEKQTEIVLAWELYEQGLSKSAIARRLGRNRETIITWIQGIERVGLKAFVTSSGRACQVSRPARQLDAVVKLWVWQIREREEQCCGQKIAYFLEREHGIKLSVPKIYEILAAKYVLRGRKRPNQTRGAVPQAHAPRQVVQVDTVHFGRVFAFTAVDIFSREAGAPWADSVEKQRHRQRWRGVPAALPEATLRRSCGTTAKRWRPGVPGRVRFARALVL